MSWFNCFMCKEKVLDIKELDLNRFGLCEVPREVFNFERTLEILHLEGNKITELPRTLFQCEELKYLNVSDNEITCIPGMISKLVNLQVLYLNRNYLCHTDISNNWTRCQKLVTLDLSSNNLDKVPESLASLVNLNHLFLNDTYIDFLPANFGRLHNLKVLELRDNMLSTLPKSLRRLTLLQRIDLSNNELTEIPEVISSMTNLTELWINSNCITTIHPGVGNLRKLVDFDASQNEIRILPKEIGQWTKMTTLILSQNSLSEIPHVIGNLRNLQTLNLESNFISELPSTIGKLTNLEELNLQDNCLNNLPSSIGFLRKLIFLVASCNQLTSLPPEIGSCTSLTVLNLHNNYINKLPEEIGHLQKLTSLGLIGNKLEYLPIPISNLPVLRALWLTQNQSHPLIPLQTEQLHNTGQLVLTCFLLPQVHTRVPEPKSEVSTNITSPSRRICFKEPGMGDEPLPRLTRAPTPYPKDLQRYERTVNNMLRKNHRDSKSVNLNVDVNAVPMIKEAKVTPMKTNSFEVEKMNNVGSSSSFRNSLVSEIDNSRDAYNNEVEVEEIKKLSGPPPYHIAAIYSKNAQFFNNLTKNELDEIRNSEEGKVTPVDKPRQFIQDQPTNILMPLPKYSIYGQQPNSYNEFLNYNAQGGLEKNTDEQLKRTDSGWVFGKHKNPRILEISLTPCYVLGFTVKYNQSGVFADQVHREGNAYQKLFPGDKIMLIEDTDLTKMEPEVAAKMVMMRGAEAESITISRNV